MPANQEFDELIFRIKEVECDLMAIEAQIERSKLEKDKLVYELSQLDSIYHEYVNQEETKAEETKQKPKKLRKSNDKPSENHIEVSIQEGRS